MRTTSTYEVQCVCGHLIVSASTNTQCSKCGRGAVLCWRPGQETKPATVRKIAR